MHLDEMYKDDQFPDIGYYVEEEKTIWRIFPFNLISMLFNFIGSVITTIAIFIFLGVASVFWKLLMLKDFLSRHRKSKRVDYLIGLLRRKYAA